MDGGAQTDSKNFPVVGVGASAGGLEAFTSLVEHLPAQTGLALVLVPHLDPVHKSILTEILSRKTSLPVLEVRDGMELESQHIYVIPPNANMKVSGGKLLLAARQHTVAANMPVDILFDSLAEDQGSNAVGVVLSGTGSDGAMGAEKIKAAGGIVFAQDDASAKYNGMPRSAVATGSVDFVLSPAEIALELARICTHPYVRPETEQGRAEDETLKKIFRLLSETCAIDFSHYKRPTIERRLGRRMMLAKIETMDDYIRYLHQNPGEVHALCQDLLIRVTGFFREPESFDSLVDSVFPRLMEGRTPKNPIRIWVPGCATGEEVYSLAICLLEYLGDRAGAIPIQLFGTDANAAVIEKARAGVYMENIESDVGPDRLRRFFTKVDGKYQVDKPIRGMCVFATQNLITDPPFAKLDIVSCRNVLIYLDETLQKRIISIFHFALKPSGFLVLGTSEAVGGSSDLFDAENAGRKIFRKKNVTGRAPFDLRLIAPSVIAAPGVPASPAAFLEGRDFQRESDRILLSKFAPAAVLVDEQLNILQFRGETDAYLSHRAGEPSLNLLKMVRPGMLKDLRAAIDQASKDGVSIRKQGLRVKTDDWLREFDLEVVPVKIPSTEARCFLIIFENSQVPSSPLAALPDAPGDLEPMQRIRQLESDLEASRDYLQSITDQQQAMNEELNSANEEILSSNEELQGTNEELQTSKEELESANEELTTVNDELASRNRELIQLNDDLYNILSSIEFPIMVLGRDLRVRRFTPSTAKILSLASTDAGRPLGEIKSNIDVPDLDKAIVEAIARVATIEREVQDKDGRWYAMRIRPYLTLDKKVDGALLTFVDIDLMKRSMDVLRQARDYAEEIVNTAREPLLVLNPKLSVSKANRAFYETFRVSADKTEGRLFYEIGVGDWNDPKLRTLLEEVLPKSNPFQDFEVDKEFHGIGRKTLLLNARGILFEGGNDMILLAMEDITERKRREEQSRLLFQEQEARKQAESANHAKDEFLSIVSHELRTPLNVISGWISILQSKEEKDEDTRARALEAMERNVRVQKALIEDLLDVARITSGRIRLEMQPVELGALLEDAAEAARLSAEDKSILVDCGSAGPADRVLGDPNRLRQIFLNLLTNAVKFTPNNGEIVVALRQKDGRAVVTVSDSGIGIPPGFLPHIFEPFRLADPSSTRRHGGLGLGLSIVKRLVELHGGEIRAESLGEGKGSTFTVSLPLTNVPKQPVKMAHGRIAEDVRVENDDISGVRVLLVDDDADTRSVLAILLDKAGAEVVTSSSVAEALRELDGWKPDIVVADIGMPDEDGYSLIRKIRSLSSGQSRRIPVIALTAYAGPEDAQRVLAAGFQSHMVKPVVPHELIAEVASFVRRIDREELK